MTTNSSTSFAKVRSWLVVVVIALGYSFAPLMVFGQETTSTAQTTETVKKAEAPIGSSAPAYTYYPEKNQWESKYYIWDSNNRREFPKFQTKVLNTETGLYDTYRWVYSPAQGEYYLNIKKAIPPEPEPAPTNAPTTEPTNDNSTSTTGPQSTNSTSSGGGGSGDNSIGNTGPNSNNEIDANGTNSINTTGPNSNNTIGDNSELDYDYDGILDATLNNNVNGVAQSGDAGVTLNTQGGDATTGGASNTANLINMLQSSWSPLNSGAGMSTFDVNLQGDIVGDMLIDPGQFDGLTNSNFDTANFDVNIATDNTINNNVNLDSRSGDAKVAMNTEGGDATTGDASSIANVINMINSMIAAGESFVGSVTVDGNFEGDILLPQGAIDQLLASSSPGGGSSSIDTTGPNSNNSIDNTSESNTDIDISNATDINNNLNLNATSGDATVRNNTSAGDASTGDAQTSVNILNLSNQSFVTENTLLVFVNVYGEWVGIIMDAPVGATSAALGGGVAGSALAPTGYGTTNTDIDIDNQNTINNNLNLNSRSGNATVANNTSAGNATTGNAYTGANIANVTNSSFGASNWFGVLFINILGDWLGSFNVNTEYGNPQQVASNSAGDIGSGATPQKNDVKVFRFVPRNTNNQSTPSTAYTPSAGPGAQYAVVQQPMQSYQPGQEAYSDKDVESAASISQDVESNQSPAPGRNWTPFIVSTFVAGLMLAGPRLAGGLRSFLF